MKKIGIVMGSDSDLGIAEKAAETLKELGVPFEVHVYSAHRTPEQAAEFSKTAREKGFGAIIAFAGKAAHLAGALAANTTLPVIGVPVKSSTLDPLVNCTDAIRNTCSYSCHRRSSQCRVAFCTDAGYRGRRSCGKAGGKEKKGRSESSGERCGHLGQILMNRGQKIEYKNDKQL